jgi:hypothetical protein
VIAAMIGPALQAVQRIELFELIEINERLLPETAARPCCGAGLWARDYSAHSSCR